MDPVNQRIFGMLVQAQREIHGLDQRDRPVATCPFCACDLYAGDGPCGEPGCPVVPTAARAAA